MKAGGDGDATRAGGEGGGWACGPAGSRCRFGSGPACRPWPAQRTAGGCGEEGGREERRGRGGRERGRGGIWRGEREREEGVDVRGRKVGEGQGWW